jgi:hypothetical protein
MATNKKSRLAEIYRSEKKKGGGVASALGKAAIEKIDPRQMFNQKGFLAAAMPSLFKAYRAAPSGGVSQKLKQLSSPTLTGDFGVLTKEVAALTMQMHEVAVNSTIIAKNTMVLPAMARDTNIIRQNISKLVKLQGETATNKSDMFFKTASEREASYESKFKKESGKTPAGGVAGTSGASLASGASNAVTGIASVLKVLADSVSKGIGIAALGVGIGGFFAGLAAGGAAVTALGGAEGVKNMMVNLAEGLEAFNTQSLLAFGALLGAGALFGQTSFKTQGSAAIGMGAVGLGIGAFFSGLALGGSIGTFIDNSSGIRDMMVNLAEGLNAFNTQSLIALGAVIAAGLFAGPVGGAKGALGIAAIGAGIATFLTALGGASALIGWISGDSPGKPLKDFLVNVAEGVKSFESIDTGKIAEVIKVLPGLGIAMLGYFGSQGIGGIIDTIGTKMNDFLNFVFGVERKKSPIEKLSEDLQKLNSISADNLSNIGKGLRDLADGLNYFSQKQETGGPGTTGPGTSPGLPAGALPIPSAPTTPLGTNRMFGAQIPTGPVTPSGAPATPTGNITKYMEKKLGITLNSQGRSASGLASAEARMAGVTPITNQSGLSASSPLKDYGTYTPSMQSKGKLKNVMGTVFHHTGGDSVNGAISTLKQRGLSYHYIIAKDGTITQLLPEGAVGYHTMPGDVGPNVKNLNNSNTIGIAFAASTDNDVTAEQIEKARALNAELSRKFGYPETSVWGHGEVNKGKMSTEGKSAVMAIRSKPILDEGSPTTGTAIASASSDLSNGRRGVSAPNITVVAPSEGTKQVASSSVPIATPIDRELNRKERLLSRQTSLIG